MLQSNADNLRSAFHTAIFVRFLRSCIAVAGEIRARQKIRKSLGNVSLTNLQDIGLIESDIDAANSAPLSQDAAIVLLLKALGRSGNW